ncbi:MAG: hypothetical protein WD512_05145, partial [Candidatus Paceibacterota bacterium]
IIQQERVDEMSTNYYCRNKKEYLESLIQDEWLDGIIKNAIDQLEVLDLRRWVIDSVIDKIKDEYNEQTDNHKYEEFHIGKRSSGQFKLEVQPNYKPNLKSLFVWLDAFKDEYEIADEYGEIMTVEELRQIILDCEHGEKWLNYSFS